MGAMLAEKLCNQKTGVCDHLQELGWGLGGEAPEGCRADRNTRAKHCGLKVLVQEGEIQRNRVPEYRGGRTESQRREAGQSNQPEEKQAEHSMYRGFLGRSLAWLS